MHVVLVCACVSLRPVYVGMDAASGGMKYSEAR